MRSPWRRQLCTARSRIGAVLDHANYRVQAIEARNAARKAIVAALNGTRNLPAEEEGWAKDVDRMNQLARIAAADETSRVLAKNAAQAALKVHAREKLKINKDASLVECVTSILKLPASEENELSMGKENAMYDEEGTEDCTSHGKQMRIPANWKCLSYLQHWLGQRENYAAVRALEKELAAHNVSVARAYFGIYQCQDGERLQGTLYTGKTLLATLSFPMTTESKVCMLLGGGTAILLLSELLSFQKVNIFSESCLLNALYSPENKLSDDVRMCRARFVKASNRLDEVQMFTGEDYFMEDEIKRSQFEPMDNGAHVSLKRVVDVSQQRSILLGEESKLELSIPFGNVLEFERSRNLHAPFFLGENAKGLEMPCALLSTKRNLAKCKAIKDAVSEGGLSAENIEIFLNQEEPRSQQPYSRPAEFRALALFQNSAIASISIIFKKDTTKSQILLIGLVVSLSLIQSFGFCNVTLKCLEADLAQLKSMTQSAQSLSPTDYEHYLHLQYMLQKIAPPKMIAFPTASMADMFDAQSMSTNGGYSFIKIYPDSINRM